MRSADFSVPVISTVAIEAMSTIPADSSAMATTKNAVLWMIICGVAMMIYIGEEDPLIREATSAVASKEEMNSKRVALQMICAVAYSLCLFV